MAKLSDGEVDAFLDRRLLVQVGLQQANIRRGPLRDVMQRCPIQDRQPAQRTQVRLAA